MARSRRSAWIFRAALAVKVIIVVLSAPFPPGSRAFALPGIQAVLFFPPGEVPLDRPVWFGEMPGRAGTFVILERLEGRVALASQADGKWSKTEFLKLAVNQDGEMGLLGVAFHPDFANNRKYYLDYNPPGSSFATLIEEREADPSFTRDSGKDRKSVV